MLDAPNEGMALEVRDASRRKALAGEPPEVRPPATAFSIERAAQGSGLRVVTVRVPGARTVEISGDFTGWKPVAMQEVSPNRWEATLAIAPGSHVWVEQGDQVPLDGRVTRGEAVLDERRAGAVDPTITAGFLRRR